MFSPQAKITIYVSANTLCLTTKPNPTLQHLQLRPCTQTLWFLKKLFDLFCGFTNAHHHTTNYLTLTTNQSHFEMKGRWTLENWLPNQPTKIQFRRFLTFQPWKSYPIEELTVFWCNKTWTNEMYPVEEELYPTVFGSRNKFLVFLLCIWFPCLTLRFILFLRFYRCVLSFIFRFIFSFLFIFNAQFFK